MTKVQLIAAAKELETLKDIPDDTEIIPILLNDDDPNHTYTAIDLRTAELGDRPRILFTLFRDRPTADHD